MFGICMKIPGSAPPALRDATHYAGPGAAAASLPLLPPLPAAQPLSTHSAGLTLRASQQSEGRYNISHCCMAGSAQWEKTADRNLA